MEAIIITVAVLLVFAVKSLWGANMPEEKPTKGYLPEYTLDEIYSRASAKGDPLTHLGKRRRQQYRGVDLYRCAGCGRTGAPWGWLPDTGVDLNDIPEDTIPDVCPCGGTICLVD